MTSRLTLLHTRYIMGNPGAVRVYVRGQIACVSAGRCMCDRVMG